MLLDYNHIPRLQELLVAAKENPDERIKKTLFSFATRDLYGGLTPVDSNLNIVVMGLVLNDGLGDYYHILNAAETIKNKFPDIKVTMIVSHMDPELPGKIQKPIPDIKAIFHNSTEGSPSWYPILNKIDQIIEISQQIHGFDIEDLFKKKYMFIGEYDHKYAKHAMGLKSSQLGIVFKEFSRPFSLIDLKNEPLKKILFGRAVPNKEDLENYLGLHAPFMGYFKKFSYYQTGFIYTAAALMKASEKTIDLILPEVKLECLLLDFLRDQGIGKISVVKIENEKCIESEQFIAEQGKELRLIHPFPLEQHDFFILLSNTDPLIVGCTGDLSFSEVLSCNRLPFYDLRSLKTGFLKDLIALTKKTIHLNLYFEELYKIYDDYQSSLIGFFNSDLTPKEHTFYVGRLKERQPRIAESSAKIASLLPYLTEELNEFIHILKTEYSFNNTLIHIFERQLAFSRKPNLKIQESNIKINYLEGKITLDQAREELMIELQSLQISLGLKSKVL